MLEEGWKAPEFTLPDQNGDMHSLSDFRGKKVVLYFYPRDNTPGCTLEAQAFRDAFEAFGRMGAAVIGISKDGPESHRKFIEKHNLPFLLLSDTSLSAIKAYDVWKEKKLYGKIVFGVVRSTYVIGEDGVIEKTYAKVKPDTNAAEILRYLSGG